VHPDVAAQILRTDPVTAFLFAQDIGAYTGDTASSLPEFLEHLATLPLESLEFHLYPRPPDFARWIQDALGDPYLATQTRKIPRTVTGDALRRTLHALIEDRLHELQVLALTGVKGIGSRYAMKLVAAGVTSIADLAHAETHDLSQKLGISERRAAQWIQNAHHTLPTT
jgi:hypothetical protein